MSARCGPRAALVMLALLGACTRTPEDPKVAVPGAEAPAPVPTPDGARSPSRVTAGATPVSGLPEVLVYKSPTCGCCAAWVEHLRDAGFVVEVHDTDALEPIKKRLGVPLGKGSCHTAEVDGLVVEGHVPVEDVRRLLTSRGDARGLVLPGMPVGSPGMEMPDGRVTRYTVEKINADGTTSPFATHGE